MNEEYYRKSLVSACSLCEEFVPCEAMKDGFEVGARISNDGELLIRTIVNYDDISVLSSSLFQQGWILWDVDGVTTHCQDTVNEDGEVVETEFNPLGIIIFKAAYTGSNQPFYSEKCI